MASTYALLPNKSISLGETNPTNATLCNLNNSLRDQYAPGIQQALHQTLYRIITYPSHSSQPQH
jgi:hypothetical protein